MIDSTPSRVQCAIWRVWDAAGSRPGGGDLVESIIWPRLPLPGPWDGLTMRDFWGSLGRRAQIALLLVLTTVLSLGALAMLAAFAGWDDVVHRLGLPDRGWFGLAVACEAVAFLGYVVAFRDV